MLESAPKRLFLILFVLGLIGVLSFLLVDLSALVGLFPMPPGEQAPTITPALKLLSLIQPIVLLALAVLAGVVLAPRVGLSSPYVESIAAGRPSLSALRPQLVPAVLGAVVGSVCILLTASAVRQVLTADVNDRLSALGTLLPLPMRLLYGGIVEELLLRWGLMTLLVWIGWRLFQKAQNKPSSITFVVAILLSSLVFAVGHLPVAVMLVGEITTAIVFFVIVANSAFGIVAGYLYWKYGLESAIVAHMLVHVVLVLASRLGAYF
jgi:hypothetical protein